jgi:GNAT superfamily N-acetyltransferase
MLTGAESVLSSVGVRVAHATDREAVARLYAETAYTPRLDEDETLIIAEFDVTLVGVLRLVDERGQLVLRGMRVREAFQRHGIGTSLLIRAGSEIGARARLLLPSVCASCRLLFDDLLPTCVLSIPAPVSPIKGRAIPSQRGMHRPNVPRRSARRAPLFLHTTSGLTRSRVR